ncbi:MAG: O-antigen ligase family protein [Plesiomonas sp.]|uniref:O-antigen ligase family protein n=1 Tax=Plesiomonas sp. TaxID=2486279 RepID=UPI003F36714D
MKYYLKENLPYIISGLFIFFICGLSVSYDSKLINNLFYSSVVLYIVDILINKKKPEYQSFHVALAIFLLISAMSTSWSDHALDTLRTFQHASYIMFFSLMIYDFRNNLLKRDTLYKSFIFTSIISVFINGLIFYSKNPITSRFYAEFGPTNTIDYAGVLCIALLFSVAILLKEKSPLKIAYYAVSIVTLSIGIILSQSRGPLLAIFASLFILLIRDKKTLLIYSLVIISTCLLLYILLPHIISRDAVDGAPSPRVFTWMYTINEVLNKNPLLGFGYNNTFGHYFEPRNITYNNPHSVYFTVLYYSGTLGLISFITLIGCGAANAIKSFTDNRLPLSLLIFMLIFCSTQGYLYIYHPREIWLLLWFPLALIAACKKLRD